MEWKERSLYPSPLRTDGAAYEYYTDDGETKDYDKPEHFVHITLDADGSAESDCENVKVEG